VERREIFAHTLYREAAMNKKRFVSILAAAIALVFLWGTAMFFVSYQRPYRDTVETSGVSPTLVYAVIKAESGFSEDAESKAGAVGLMQLMPETAEFMCELEGIAYNRARLTEGEYNIRLGCAYLAYLLAKFPCEETAVAAYNAGEGTVTDWLGDRTISPDGIALKRIPYPETQTYVKKIKKFQKIYKIFYDKT